MYLQYLYEKIILNKLHVLQLVVGYFYAIFMHEEGEDHVIFSKAYILQR